MIVRSATDFAIVTCDPAGLITSWSPGAEAVMGWTAAEAVHQHIALFFTPEDVVAGRPEAEMAESATTGSAADERWHLKRDGTRFWASGELQPLRENCRTVGFVKILRDRTEHVALQEKLAAAEQQTSAAEKRITADGERLQAMFAAAPGFIAVLRGPDHVFDFANASYNRLVGNRPLIGRSVREALPEVRGQGFYALLDLVYASGNRATAAQQPIMLTGESGTLEQRFVSFVYEPMRDPDGAVTGIFVEGFDSTDAALARAKADQVSAEQAAILGQLAEGVVATDETGRITFVNAAAAALHGVARLDVGPEDYSEAYQLLTENGEPYPSSELPLARAVARAEIVRDARWRIRRPDRSEVLAIGNAQPVVVDGRQIGAVLTVRDDTERSLGEERIRRSEAELKLVLDASAGGFYAVDADGVARICNRNFLRLLGFEREDEVLGRRLHDVIHHSHPDNTPYRAADCPIHRAAAGGQPAHVADEVFFRRDGTPIPVEYWAEPIFRDGKHAGAVCTFIEISARRVAENALREETRTLETLNEVFAQVAGELDLERVVQLVTDAGREITGAEFGAFFYNRVTDQGDMMLYTLSGIDRSAFERFGMPRATAIFHPTLSGEGLVRSDDITKDSRYGLSAPHHGMPEGHVPVRSYLAVPVVSRSGDSIGGLFYGHGEAGRFDARHERLLVGIAGQAATAIDNARLFEAAQREIARRQKVEERREFLLQLGDRLRVARTADGAKLAAAESLGSYLGAARAGYGEVDEEGEIVRVRRDWISGPEIGSLAGEARILDGFGPDIVAELRAGRTLVVEDCMADSRAGEAYAETWNSIGCRSLVVVPLVRDDRLRALFYLHEPFPRCWTGEEVALADEVAARTWDAVARARAEDALRASETRYRTLFEAIDAGFCILQMKFDAQGHAVDYRFDEVNPAFGRQTGLFDAQGRWIRDLTPDFEQHWVDLYGRVARTREPARYENASEALGRWFDVYAFAIDGPDDGRVAVLFNDISERKKAELDLTELNRTLEARVAQTVAERDMIWRTSQDLFLVCGFDGFYRSANPAWHSVMGYELEDVVGARFDAFVNPDDVPLATEAFEGLVAGKVVKGLDIRIRARDGSERWVSWTCVPHGDAFYAAGRDVTGRKELEEQLRQSQKMEAVGQLTGGIAHDFNNLLTIVSGNIDMAKRSLGADGNPRALRSLGNAAKGADRAAALTQRLLAFSRRQPLQPRETDVNKLITGMTELLDRALGETVDLQVVTGAGLWRVEVDPNQLENAILNLAVNARDAMPTGGKLTIETNNAAIDDAYAASQREVVPGQYVLISVTDTGEGMPPEIVAKAFDPFFSTKEVGKGTGLGLSQVYGYVKQSGGHVKIYSEAGQGTTIKIYLPRLVAAINGVEEDAAEAIPAAPGMESILVVEDDDDVRIYTVDSLRELGYRVLEAHDAASALRLLERQDEAPRLLLTDVVMPGMSGRELADTARAKWPEMRVLFTTGYARNAIVHGGRLDAGVELLPKPFTYEALAAKIREVLEKSGSGRAMVLDASEKERSGIAAALTRLGFEAEPAADLREALGKLRAAAGRFDVVVMSGAIPVENLDAAIAKLHAVRNDLPVLIISAGGAERLPARYADRPCVGVVCTSRMPDDLEDHLTRIRVECANAS